MIKVEKGQDPYSVIGQYIRDHVSVIEDMIAVIDIDGVKTNELFMVDMQEDGYFVWKSDWWEGEENVSLVDFFPVSDAQKPSAQPEQRWIPCSERFPEDECDVLACRENGSIEKMHYNPILTTRYPKGFSITEGAFSWRQDNVAAWMPLPEPWKGEACLN